MATIEANITIDVPEEVNVEFIIAQIQEILSSFNGKQTNINVIETDNPITASPLRHQNRGY